MTSKEEFKIDFTKYKSGLTVEILDKMFNTISVNSASTSKLDKLYAVIMLIAYACYYFARKGAVDTQMEIDKQKFNQQSLLEIHDTNEVV